MAHLAILSISVIAACGNTTEPEGPVSIEVENLRYFLELGDQVRFVAVSPGQTGSLAADWKSSNPAAVTIDRTGLAIAHAIGFSDITVSVHGTRLNWRLGVVRRIAAVRVEPGSIELLPGEVAVFTGAPVDASGASVTDDPGLLHDITAAITWSVADPGIAGFGDDTRPQFLTALREGQTTVNAHLYARTGTANVTVHLLEFSDLAVGGAFNCALATDSLPYCWGEGTTLLSLGPGRGDWTPKFIPHRLEQRLNLVSVTAGGRHACGLTQAGLAYCWGSNEWGALGIGTAAQPNGPALVAGGLRFAMLSAGGLQTCGITTDGRAFCWGVRNGGSLEEGPELCGTGGKWAITMPCSRAPRPVGNGSLRFTSLSAGGRHTCGITGSGNAYCWGFWGSLGVAEPTPVNNSFVFTAVTSGDGYSCGLTQSGAAYCWGANEAGQLGNGLNTASDEPAPVVGELTFVSLSASRSEFLGSQGHVCGVTTSHDIYCWGSNLSGELGVTPGASHTTPVRATASGFRSVQSGGAHTCGVSLEGVVFCWGANYGGQLGTPGNEDRPGPLPVVGQRPK